MSPRRTIAAGVMVALAAGAAGMVVALGGDDPAPAAGSGRASETATVERRDLVARTTIDGTLGYADARPAGSALPGTLTWVAVEGDTVEPGETLFRIDDQRVLLLDGERPAWRELGPGMTDGRDVEQLERNLHALDFDDGYEITVDKEWTSATTAAVKALQDAAGLEEDGALEMGRVVFLPGERRIGSQDVRVGAAVGPGRGVVTTTSVRREVTASLPAEDQGAAHEGDRVDVALPDGSLARGRIATVGAVAKAAAEDGSPTIDVTVTLPAHGIPKLDQAPVSVSLASRRLRDAVAVPVIALVARPGGGYGVELVEDEARRLVPVTPGLFADGWVEVGGLRPGQRVAVPE